MNTNKLSITLLAWMLIYLFASHVAAAQGYIVPNGVVTNYGGLFFPNEIDVLHNPANPTSPSSYTWFLLNPVGTAPPSPFPNTFRFDPVLDVGVRVFLVSPDDPVSLQPILAGDYMELQSLSSYVFNSGSPFYVGLYTGNVQSPPPDGIYSDPLFGWAELENNRGVIELLDGALVYQAAGIYAGTLNIIEVPEPGVLPLLCLGCLLIAALGRKAAYLR
jgi:hypothetical protein